MRRAWRGLTAAVVVGVGLSVGVPQAAPADEATAFNSTIAVEIGDLEDQLKVGLRPRRPEEFAFITLVIAKLQTDQLPLQMVLETFDWARKKKRYQIVYF